MKRALTFALCFTLVAAAADAPKRIVSLSPDLTEILYGVGAFNRVVAVSDYDTYPAETAKLPHLGQLHSPSLEKLAGMRPDLVVINAAQAPFLEDSLRELNLRIVKTSNKSVADIYASILTIGHATGNDSEAAKLVAATHEGLDRVARRTAKLPKVPVVLIVDRLPGTLRDLYTATDGSFLAELVEIAGGRIAVPPVDHGYKKLSKEDLLAVNPEIILEFIQGKKSRFAGDPMEAWHEMPELKAVHNHRVYGLPEDFVPHASQRIVQTAELFAKKIHPEIQ
jgi:iron complex transport system substrate-binding protein